jgi:bifunctional pyridoxal-dependent enzyme with beta-cystathionase and maltose regulon repressor activities
MNGTNPAEIRRARKEECHEDPTAAASSSSAGWVAFEPDPLFGTGGEGFVRLNFATSPAILNGAVQRMRAAIPSTDEP